jgi:hypothetical protein
MQVKLLKYIDILAFSTTQTQNKNQKNKKTLTNYFIYNKQQCIYLKFTTHSKNQEIYYLLNILFYIYLKIIHRKSLMYCKNKPHIEIKLIIIKTKNKHRHTKNIFPLSKIKTSF